MHIPVHHHRRVKIYSPLRSPGFVAWTSTFDYGNGRIGLSFKEIIAEPNGRFAPPTLEFAEAACAPVSYGSAFFGSPEQSAYRVYMASDDSGESFYETGRCALADGSFCNIGFPDGKIVGMEVVRTNNDWCSPIRVSKSLDGGSTWETIATLLEGCSIYMWRAKKLRDGTIVLAACLYGTPWGENFERPSRNSIMQDETYISKIQTFILVSEDGGVSWDGPHYILQGVGAHEYDFVELPDGCLLFIAGDVQSTPAVRQIVRRKEGRFINGTVFPIHKGAPPDPVANAQGGYIPETICLLQSGLLVGSRRHKPYSCSGDNGANWHIIEDLPKSLYQPCICLLPNGDIANFGHLGGDLAFGQKEMFIGADIFRIEDTLPKPTHLKIIREKSEDESTYLNSFEAALTCGDTPIANALIQFKVKTSWRENGTGNMDEANTSKEAMTGEDGMARVTFSQFDNVPDIHFSYYVTAVYAPADDASYGACESPTLYVSALAPKRKCRFPHPAFFAEGVLFIAPSLLDDFPGIMDTLKSLTGRPDNAVPDGFLPDALLDLFVQNGVILKDGSLYKWMRSVHSAGFLEDVKIQTGGDLYV